jgi:hypothetical protein
MPSSACCRTRRTRCPSVVATFNAPLAAATKKLAQRIRDGQVPKVKVYDKAAPSKRPVIVPTPELQRTRDRAAPAPVR